MPFRSCLYAVYLILKHGGNGIEPEDCPSHSLPVYRIGYGQYGIRSMLQGDDHLDTGTCRHLVRKPYGASLTISPAIVVSLASLLYYTGLGCT